MNSKDFKDILVCIVNDGAILKPQFFNYDLEQPEAKTYFRELKQFSELFGGTAIIQSLTADDLRK